MGSRGTDVDILNGQWLMDGAQYGGLHRYLPPAHALWRMKSATCSAIIMVVALVLARMQSGITDASATRSPSSPYTRQYWSTTAIGSEAGPILQVPEICCVVLTLRRSQASSALSEASSWSLGASRWYTMP